MHAIVHECLSIAKLANSYDGFGKQQIIFEWIPFIDAGAVIHTHSKWTSLITQLLSNKSELRISHQEMIKGIKCDETGKYLRYDDTLVVPIIENTPFEADLQVRTRKLNAVGAS